MPEIIRQGDVRRPTEVPRISERYSIDPIEATWFPPKDSRFSNKPKRAGVQLIDLSVAGAQIVGPFNRSVAVGMRVPFELGGEKGIVEVRNIRDIDGLGHYGVTFYKISERLEQAVFAAVGKRRNDDRLASDWRRND